MATVGWFHASLKPISRGSGRSAVACAAYRTGSRMNDERYAAVRDFSRKDDVVTAFTMAPDRAPAWATDAERLWNAVESRERRRDSQLAFEWEVALPNDLTAEQRESIAREFTGWLVNEYGVAVTTGIHEGGNRGNGLNDHMHVMMTTRSIGEEGWSNTKLRDFSTKPGAPNVQVNHVREQIAEFINHALEDAGNEDRVDHRSFKDRGIDRQPTTHLGPAAAAMERKQQRSTDRGDINREIIEDRLSWQQDQAHQEITPELEQMFSQRWEGWQPLRRGVDLDAAPALAVGTPADDSERHRGWRWFTDRAKAFRDRAVEFWHDETSGTPEAERGFAARLFDSGRKLWQGWHHRDPHEFAEGLHDSVALARELSGERPADGDGPKTFAERLRERATDFLKNERGSVPDIFDREAQKWQSHSRFDFVESPSQIIETPEGSHRAPDGPDIE